MEEGIITDVHEAIRIINASEVTAGLELKISDTVWKDAPGVELTGINMALITDAVLGRGLFPSGFEDKDGYRLYKFSKKSRYSVRMNRVQKQSIETESASPAARVRAEKR